MKLLSCCFLLCKKEKLSQKRPITLIIMSDGSVKFEIVYALDYKKYPNFCKDIKKAEGDSLTYKLVRERYTVAVIDIRGLGEHRELWKQYDKPE